MTDDERRVKEIEKRVRDTICETFDSSGNQTVEGRISQDDFAALLASRLSWRLVAKMKEKTENISSSDMNVALDKALDSTTAELIKAQDEIEVLTARIAIYERVLMRNTASVALN